MKTHEAVKVLMRLLDDNQPKQKAIIWDAFVKMFDLMIEEYEALRPKEEPPRVQVEIGAESFTVKTEKPKTKHYKTKFDVGKLGALRKAGWSVAKIAEEMGVTDQTVRNYMKREGIK